MKDNDPVTAFLAAGRALRDSQRNSEEVLVGQSTSQLRALAQQDCLLEERLYEAALALPDAPHWTREAPKEEGIYWMRYQKGKPYLSAVWDEKRGYPCMSPLQNPCIGEDLDYPLEWWSERVVPPVEDAPCEP